MSDAWRTLRGELARWRAAGRTASFWWRDDDAGAVQPALERLLALQRQLAVPLALAAIPEQADKGLAERLAGLVDVSVLQHGWRHRNLAAAGARKAEFGDDRPVFEMLADVALGRAKLAALFGERALPVFVPPWNRVAADLLPFLPDAGIRGLSRFRERRSATPAAGLVEINCHVDPIAWKGHRGFLGEAIVVEQIVRHLAGRRGGDGDGDEPTGILTHHRQFDADCWQFAEKLLQTLRECDGAHWLTAPRMFSVAP